MPQLIIKGISKEETNAIASNLAISLADVIKCPKEWISIELAPTEYFNSHSSEESFPVVNIHWFPRPKDMQDKVADLVKKYLFEQGHSRIQIYFHCLDPKGYYEFK